MIETYDAAWKRYRKLRNRFLVALLGLFPFVWVISHIAAYFPAGRLFSVSWTSLGFYSSRMRPAKLATGDVPGAVNPSFKFGGTAGLDGLRGVAYIAACRNMRTTERRR
jgi:hypothetical protein